MKMLHIDTSILADHSVSRKVSAAIVERLRKQMPGSEPIESLDRPDRRGGNDLSLQRPGR